MKKIVVLGKNGRLGHALCEASIGKAMQVYALDRHACNVLCDRRIANVLDKYEPTYVINATGYTNVALAREEKDRAWALNVQAVQWIASACRQRNIAFIQMSSDYVFSGQDRFPWYATDAIHPQGYYAYTKAMGEQCVLQTMTKGMIVRAGWFHQGKNDFVAKILDRVRESKAPLSVTKEQVGKPTYILHLARWLLRSIESRIERHSLEIVHYREQGSYVSRFGWAQYILQQAIQWAYANRQSMWAQRYQRALANLDDQYVLPNRQPKNCRLANDRTDHWSVRSVPHWQEGTQKSVIWYCQHHCD